MNQRPSIRCATACPHAAERSDFGRTLWRRAGKQCRPAPGNPAGRWSLLAACAATALVALVWGCGPAEEPRYEVHGTVRFQGQPIREGRVALSNTAKGVHLNANVNPDGTYEVKTYRGKGLPSGEYVVTVLPPVRDDPPVGDPWPFIPARYRNPATSGLKLTVAEGDNPFDVDMKP
jgi:hypothetical protein